MEKPLRKIFLYSYVCLTLVTLFCLSQCALKAQTLNNWKLINTINDQEIISYTSDFEIDLTKTGNALNIVAEVSEDTRSAELFFDGEYISKTLSKPYSFGGDLNGDFQSFNLDVGEHELEIHLFKKPGLTGPKKIIKNIIRVFRTDDPNNPFNLGSNIGTGEIKVKGELKKWHKVTLEINGPRFKETDNNPNPFLDLRLQAVFKNGNKTYVVPGYFAADGNAGETSATEGNIWKVHFAPDLEGTWSYTIDFKVGPEAAVTNDKVTSDVMSVNGKTGSFEIKANDKTSPDLRAKGRLSYIGEHFLQFEETKEFFVKGGPDAPENLLAFQDFDGQFKSDGIADLRIKKYLPHIKDWKNGDPTWQNGKGKGLIGAINYLASEGLNTFSFLTFNSTGDDKNVFPYTTEKAFKTFDISKLDQWEIVFQHGQDLGFHLHFKTQETENDQLLDGGAVGVNRKLYYRELIARFAHHLALNWNLGEENTQTTEQRIAMAEYLYNNDPYQHHIVIHTFPGQQNKIYDPMLGNKSKLTGISLQTSWKNVYRDTKKWIDASVSNGKKWVVANDEQNSANIGVPEDAYTGTPNLNDIRKQTLWGNFMAGGAGVEYYFGYQRPESDLTLEDFRSRDRTWDFVRHALNFMKNQPVTTMKAINGFSNKGWTLGKTNDTYIVYLPTGSNASVNLPEGTFNVQWYDPRNGGNLQQTSIKQLSKNGNNNLGNPPNNVNDDWVVLIKNTSEVTDPDPTPDPPTLDCSNPLFEEENGILIVEAENTQLNEFWTLTNSFDQNGTGEGHIEYIGPNSFGKANENTELTYRIKINNPGTYSFAWRSRNGKNAKKFDEENDSWLNIEADAFYGVKGGSNLNFTKNQFIKIWIQKMNWSYEMRGEANGQNGFPVFATFDKAGEYKIRIRGRSKFHPIDRIVLYKNDKNIALNPSTAESIGCRSSDGGDPPTKDKPDPNNPNEPNNPNNPDDTEKPKPKVKVIASLDQFQTEDLLIYPNPSHHGFVHFELKGIKKSSVEILSLNGQVIESFKLSEQKNKALNHLNSGMYIVKYSSNDQTAFKKLLVD